MTSPLSGVCWCTTSGPADSRASMLSIDLPRKDSKGSPGLRTFIFLTFTNAGMCKKRKRVRYARTGLF
jgi:hypothetical protein